MYCDCGYETQTKKGLLNHQKYCLFDEVISCKELLKQKNRDLESCRDQLHRYRQLLIENEKRLAVAESRLESSTQIQSFMKEITMKTIDSKYKKSKVEHLLPLTDDYISSCAKHFDEQYTLDGALGYAKFALEYPFKDRLICTNRQSKTLKYKDEHGGEGTSGKHIIDVFIDSIRMKNREIISPRVEELVSSLAGLDGALISSTSEKICALGEQMHLKDGFVDNIHKHICTLLS